MNSPELPDGSSFGVMSLSLPEDHWLFIETEWDDERDERSDCPLHIFPRVGFEEYFRDAARYAIRASTMNGQDTDFDPDAMVLNFIYAVCGPVKGVKCK